VDRMPPRPPLGLFDNPVRLYSLHELTETVCALERSQPGRAADALSNAVFEELRMKRTQRAAELVAEAIRRARSRGPGEDIGGSRWQASYHVPPRQARAPSHPTGMGKLAAFAEPVKECSNLPG
jgi:hypothetical protein